MGPKPVVVQMICSQCEQLWKAYENAVFEHVRLTGKLRLAEASGDSAPVNSLAADVARAEQKRVAAREALLTHERDAGHGDQVREDRTAH